jgi:hypothetical protein
MGDETWFRGEGVGVTPNPAGKNLLDYGDGLYLSDKEDVALQYARLRAPGDNSWQVLEATIDRQSLGKVLDLTTDPRWQRFMTQPMYPGTNNANLNKSRLEYVRMKNELYGQFFKEFQQAHNIDIKTYDAVVGPEYVRGGKQLCILNKNGFPTRLSARVRALFRPRVAQGGFTVKPMSSNWPRAIGGFLVTAGISIVIAYVAQKIMNRINDNIIRQAMESFRPELEKFAAEMRLNVVDRLANGEGAFVSAYIEVAFPMMPNQDYQNPGYIVGLPLVHIAELTVSPKDLSNIPVKHTKDSPGLLSGGIWQDLYYFWISGKPPIEKEEVELYRNFLVRLKWCEDTLNNPNIADSDRSWIEKERIKLKQWRDGTYPSTNYKPNRDLWTEDGYSEMMSSGWGSEPAKL